jgi:SecD/SecF fusion protein
LQKRSKSIFDKIVGQGGGPVLGLFSKDTATINGYLKEQISEFY